MTLGSCRLSRISQCAGHQSIGSPVTSSIISTPLRGSKERGHEHFSRWETFKKLCSEGKLKDALNTLELIQLQAIHSVPFSNYTSLLQICIDSKALTEGKQIHAHILKNEIKLNTFVYNHLLHMYVKCSSVNDARQIFDSMSHRDMFTWTVIIRGHVKSGLAEEAFELFSQMEYEGLKPNEAISVSVLKSCATLAMVREIHVCNLQMGINPNTYIGNTLVNMYSKCGSVEDALEIFIQMSVHDVVSWNSIIAGCTQHGCNEAAFELFQEMKFDRIKPDQVTFLGILKACASMGGLKMGRCVHSEISYGSFESSTFVASALVDMYAKCESIEDARRVFDKMLSQDVVSWNSIIAGYAQHGDAKEAFELFARMEQKRMQPDRVTFLSLLKACTTIGFLDRGKEIHARIRNCGFETSDYVGSALVDMYVKCGSLENARELFLRLPQKDLVSWNAMIAGYSIHGPAKEAFRLFHKMKMEGLKPDKVTFLTILKACGNSGVLEKGKHIHACILENGFDSYDFMGSSLIDMYAKCGSVDLAWQVFNMMHKRDEVSWSALITGYAQNGHAEEAFELFVQMQQECVTMDSIIFVGVLAACTNAGLVDKGLQYFNYMRKDHGITPTAEHCACLVGLLGRAGRLKDAIDLIEHMAGQLDASVWMTLLSACRTSGDLELAKYAAERVLKFDPQSTGAHVLLSNIYAAGNILEDGVEV